MKETWLYSIYIYGQPWEKHCVHGEMTTGTNAKRVARCLMDNDSRIEKAEVYEQGTTYGDGKLFSERIWTKVRGKCRK